MVLIDDRVNVYHVVEVCVTKSLQSLNETYHSSFNLNYTLLSFLHYCVYLSTFPSLYLQFLHSSHLFSSILYGFYCILTLFFPLSRWDSNVGETL